MATIEAALVRPVAVTDDWSEIPANTVVNATIDELAAAFTEWDRRYREEPERFQSEAAHLLKDTPETYGAACAPYLAWILAQQAEAR
jgi:hypothetical protein